MERFKKNQEKYIVAVMAVLTLVLIVLFIALIQQYLDLRQQRMIDDHVLWLSFINRHTPLTAADTNVIQPWMTFDYVNRVFNLPRTYLQTALSVGSASYPQLPLYRFAESQKISPATFTDEVRNAVRSYVPAK